ncbi:hypothetical protein D3C77_554140 [compost metagenome]
MAWGAGEAYRQLAQAAAVGVQVAHEKAEHFVKLVLGMAVFDLAAPAVAKLLLQRGEEAGLFVVVV